MTCPQCQGVERLFNHKTAVKELRAYRKKGPDKTTRLLIDALKTMGVESQALLDIGGGVGAIQHELLKAGAGRAINVDASAAYIKTAKDEAQRLDLADRVAYHCGDFVQLAPDLPAAHIVTLDRSICCYPDAPTLVGLSAEKAENLYGLVYPRDTWWLKLGATVINAFFWLQRNPFRFFIHPSHLVEGVIREQGLTQRFYRKTMVWQVVVYGRGE